LSGLFSSTLMQFYKFPIYTLRRQEFEYVSEAGAITSEHVQF